MRTTLKITILAAAAAFMMIEAGMICKSAYSDLKERYVSEAEGRGLAFINSLMY